MRWANFILAIGCARTLAAVEEPAPVPELMHAPEVTAPVVLPLVPPPAAEPTAAMIVRDLRLGWSQPGGAVSSSGSFSGPAPVPSGGADRDASRTRITLGVVGAWVESEHGGLLAGLGLAYETAEATGQHDGWGEAMTQSWMGIIGYQEIGWAYAFDRRYHVEGAFRLGLGQGRIELEDLSGIQFFGTGTALIFEYGLRFGGYATFEHWVAGLEAGWYSTSYLDAEWASQAGGNTYGEDATFTGPWFGLSVGYRL